MGILWIVVASIYGLAIGSFLNAVIYRVPRKESLNTRSHCPQCDAKIIAVQNIPLISYLRLRGKCASCGLPISLRYPAVEFAGSVSFGVVTAWALYRFDLPSVPLTFVILGLLWLVAASIALSLIDFDLQLLPTLIIWPTLLVMAVTLCTASLLTQDYAQLLRALAGMCASGLLYGIIWAWKPGAMGFGDVRLSLIIGLVTAWVSWGTLALSTFLAFGLAAVIGVAMLTLSKANGKTAIPFGPFMLAGMWTGLFFGPAIIDSYLSIGGLS